MPLLFSAYASKLFEVIKLYLLNARAFADDTQLCLSFNPDNSLNEAEAVHAMEQCIRAIRAWMQADKLQLNENKTEVMLIGTRQQLSKVNLGTLTARSAQQDQEDNRRQGVLCSRADPVERSSRRVESSGQSQNFYGTVKNSLF